MPNDKDLVKVRGSYKGQLTTFLSYLKTLHVGSLSLNDVSELQMRLGKLMALYDKYDEVQLALECQGDDEDQSAQLRDRADFESLYYKGISDAQILLDSHKKPLEESERRSRSSNFMNNVKLPTIQLPKFSGSYDNWLGFHDTFCSLIHNNSDIDEINKFHYLRASLEGSAAIVIQSIEFSSKNYSVAWGLLCERFNNKRLLIQNHVSALFNLENITKECSFTLKRLLDKINQNLRALESLGEPVQYWDTLIIYLITQKLDVKTYREWEEWKGRLSKNEKITLDYFQHFLRNRADLVETLEMSRNTVNQSNQNHNNQTKNTNPKIKTMVSVQSSSRSCQLCNGEHNLANCSQFLSLSNDARLKLLPTYKVCYNCFSNGHFANQCKKKGCKVCKRKHHTLVHINDFKSKQAENGHSSFHNNSGCEIPSQQAAHTAATGSHADHSNTGARSNANPNVILSASIQTAQSNDVLLSTALIKVYDSQNKEHVVRAILDSGSTSCLMTEKLYRNLNLPASQINKSIIGINNVSSQINKMCRLPITSLNDNFATTLHCFILPSITDNIPHHQVDLTNINIPSGICLADPHFHTPAAVDMIIGADVFWDILGSQRVTLGEGKPILFETRLGWVVSGPININNSFNQSRAIKCNFTQTSSRYDVINDCDSVQNQLMRFWQLEEVSHQLSHFSAEEKSCEDHFVKNTTRLEDGRFCVKVPLKESPQLLGDSLQRAEKCFLSLERRLQNQPKLNQLYKDFMSEYESLGHMSAVDTSESDKLGNFIPHHGVLRESSSTTKLRAVFNASSPTTSGVTYNDIQMVGPTIQDDLLSILLRFRQHQYVLSADVEKMYRQIVVHPDFRHLQQIVWRCKPSEPLKFYQLNTVTYGTASAPFLATRCLREVGLQSRDEKIKEIIMRDFYVDDLLTGGDTIEDVIYIREQVTAELASACMPLRKWRSNEPHLVSEPNQSPIDLNIGSTEPSKTLGLCWQTSDDELRFPIGTSTGEGNTKRELLSVIAQIFDPLGLLSPYIIKMKMLLQRLWLHQLSWDEPLPIDVRNSWQEIIKDLPCLNNLRVPRVVICDLHQWMEIHVFTDASVKAYGACLYIRSMNSKGEVLVRLLMAKSRVAPLKPTTIPRLELCGALVGTHLYTKVINSLRVTVRSVTFWTDSTIVLGWLRMMPNKLQPFVRNRVAEILETTGDLLWRHVPTDLNPADFISRGVNISTLQCLDMWWSCPGFLMDIPSKWPGDIKPVEKLPELCREMSLHLSLVGDNKNGLIDFSRFSKFLKLIRTAAYVLRFIKACKKNELKSNFLSQEEIQQGLDLTIKLSQVESFPECELLLQQKPLPKRSPLCNFNVFLDDHKIIRVGGRLSNSSFPFHKKYPILIQSAHSFSKLLFEFEHLRLMHAGPQLLLNSIHENYWPIGGRRLAKSCYRRCVRCARMRGRTLSPLMGDLPTNRLTPGYPFENVGVDYAGPIASASRQGRGCRIVKVYIAIFVCFSTKAIHLELVGDLTSNNYLLALRRFMSRRGKPVSIYSDNGTSFVGASNDLSQFLLDSGNSLSENVANEGINFRFIPAYSPHFGGLWEAGVKSTKFHLQRVLGHCHLTYEELNTTLVQIEAILNSRPLTPMSSDPEDLMPLTPGHFIIGRPLTSLPARDLTSYSSNHLNRYQRIEQLRQHFWSRWYKEYVSQLQHRIKWKTRGDTLKLNSLVVLKDDNLPPLKWKLGRIVAVYPGADGISRVADVRTAGGVLRRSFTRICPLPEADEVVGSAASNVRGHV
ncbi:uncharacterized protein LOC126366489 [Pectinophora gossypiella]|uniref:uncharacterized protein LOC126366489 n=1 Tax=Pectinophora gossypiella TaxID=13191 RepID=UPI00214F529C|nr:uncharacterized protein LOC126366489 [Pectinophora gossypiella]XP_049865558.1 uncharacterized protein LOC126366489 [Pectinophora gossypiella]